MSVSGACSRNRELTPGPFVGSVAGRPNETFGNPSAGIARPAPIHRVRWLAVAVLVRARLVVVLRLPPGDQHLADAAPIGRLDRQVQPVDVDLVAG